MIDMRELEAAASGCREMACLCNGYVDSTRLHPGPLLAAQQVARLLTRTDKYCKLRGTRGFLLHGVWDLTDRDPHMFEARQWKTWTV